MCERLAIMDHGHLLAIDTPQNLKESIGADTIITISATGDLDALASMLCDSVEGATKCQKIDGTVKLQLKGATVTLPRIVTLADQNGFNITDLSVAPPTLETVFINLTGKELRD